MHNDSAKRFMVHSTVKRINIMDTLLEQSAIDRNDLLNKLIFQWVISKVDEDLKQPVKEVFGY